MEMHISIEFVVKEKEVTCKARYNGRRFIHTRKVERQSERIDSYKRAKQLAYCGVMNKIHGYACDNVNHLEKLERKSNECGNKERPICE